MIFKKLLIAIFITMIQTHFKIESIVGFYKNVSVDHNSELFF